MADDSEIVNRAMRLLQEAADVLAQTNINVDTSSSQSTSITTPNTRPSTNDHTSTSAASTVLTVTVLQRVRLGLMFSVPVRGVGLLPCIRRKSNRKLRRASFVELDALLLK